jgi:hypothetical protein
MGRRMLRPHVERHFFGSQCTHRYMRTSQTFPFALLRALAGFARPRSPALLRSA